MYVAIALSGLTALGAEVVWTRILSLLFGATAYTFSLILAVFLVGLGIGSSLGAALARGVRTRGPRSAGCSSASVRVARVGRVRDERLAAVLADQSVDLDRRRLQLPARSDARDLGDAAGRAFSGARASRWRLRRWPRAVRTRRGWSAASTRPTPSAPSSARWSPASAGRHVGSQVAQQVLIGVAALSGLLMLMPANGERRGALTSTPVVGDRRRARRRSAGAHRCRRCPGFSSPTAATRRRGSGRTRSSTSAKGSPRRSPCRGRRTAC